MERETQHGMLLLGAIVLVAFILVAIQIARSFMTAKRKHVVRAWALQGIGICLMALGAVLVVVEILVHSQALPADQLFHLDIANDYGLLSIAGLVALMGGAGLFYQQVSLSRWRDHMRRHGHHHKR
jgi:hypothetical protein